MVLIHHSLAPSLSIYLSLLCDRSSPNVQQHMVQSESPVRGSEQLLPPPSSSSSSSVAAAPTASSLLLAPSSTTSSSSAAVSSAIPVQSRHTLFGESVLLHTHPHSLSDATPLLFRRACGWGRHLFRLCLGHGDPVSCFARALSCLMPSQLRFCVGADSSPFPEISCSWYACASFSLSLLCLCSVGVSPLICIDEFTGMESAQLIHGAVVLRSKIWSWID